jgi:acetyl-CoA acetyltransferase
VTGVQTCALPIFTEEWLVERKSSLWMPMIQTADIVGDRYKVSRQAQDEFALLSQKRTAAAQEAGKFNDEIVPMTVQMEVVDKATGTTSMKEITLSKDEYNRRRRRSSRCKA